MDQLIHKAANRIFGLQLKILNSKQHALRKEKQPEPKLRPYTITSKSTNEKYTPPEATDLIKKYLDLKKNHILSQLKKDLESWEKMIENIIKETLDFIKIDNKKDITLQKAINLAGVKENYLTSERERLLDVFLNRLKINEIKIRQKEENFLRKQENFEKKKIDKVNKISSATDKEKIEFIAKRASAMIQKNLRGRGGRVASSRHVRRPPLGRNASNGRTVRFTTPRTYGRMSRPTSSTRRGSPRTRGRPNRFRQTRPTRNLRQRPDGSESRRDQSIHRKTTFKSPPPRSPRRIENTRTTVASQRGRSNVRGRGRGRGRGRRGRF